MTLPGCSVLQRPQPVLVRKQPARPSVIPGVEDVGERFFQTVFEELSAGDIGIAPNRDNTVLYVTKIKDRYPSNDEELATLRENFLNDMQLRQRNKQFYCVGSMVRISLIHTP